MIKTLLVILQFSEYVKVKEDCACNAYDFCVHLLLVTVLTTVYFASVVA